MSNNYYVHGAWNAICDGCGFKYKSIELRKQWDGFMMCKDCFEMRHPLDLIKAPRPEQAPPWTRPVEANPTYIDVTVVDTGNNDIPSGNFDTNNGNL